MSSFQYIVFYKPFQVLSQFSAEGDKRTLADFFKGIEKNIYPVGRLDYDSEGLLLLTNDTALNQKLLNPESKYQKTYQVQVEGSITNADIEPLRKGVLISVNGKKHLTLPAKVEVIATPQELPDRDPPIRYRKNIPTSWISVTIEEGKNRQVRKMTAAIGFPTLRLIRTMIGSMSIDGMRPGSFKLLTPKELRLLLQK